MSNYTITNKSLNKNKVFILQKSELEKRFDPSWYVYLKSIEGFKQKSIPLKELLTSNPQYGANEIGIERNTASEPRYIRITDINEFGELKNELGKSASNIEEKYFLEENDLLLARSGNTVGKSYLHKNKNYNCFFAGYMIRFKIDSTKVNPKYIFVFTQTTYYKKWINAVQRSTGQPNINAEEYKNLKILFPNISIQESIINIYDSFLTKKKENETKSKTLLNSIDIYLLQELGITLPKKEVNTLKSRIFTSSISVLSGTRFDPNYHKNYFHQVFHSIEKGKYEYSKMNKYASFQAGYAFKSKDYIEKSDCALITIKNIKKNEISLNEVTFLPSDFYELYKEFQINKNDLLIAMTGATIGKVGIYNHTNKALLNQRNGIIKPNSLNPVYLLSLLNLKIYQEIILRSSNGGAQPNISENDIMNISIPIPPIEKQNEISEHISAIRKQAKDLINLNKELLQKANEEIENLILKS